MCAAPKGYSLHIGLNFVDPDHYDGWDGELKACEADADDMEALAVSLGYVTDKLLRGEATRDAVIKGISAAAASLNSGDIFLVTYSGHGGQVPNGAGGDDEIDGMDETWCLFDGQMIDDEFEILWRRFAAGVRIVMVSDSCHSGTVTRARLSVAQMPDLLGVRTPPSPVLRRTYLANEAFYSAIQIAAALELARQGPLDCTVRLLSGCRDDELSYDGLENGAFTAALLAAWDYGRIGGDYTSFHREILKRIRTPQTPQHMVIGRPDPQFDAQTPFAILDLTATTRTRGAVAAMPRNYNQRAELAIEKYLIDSGRSNDVPAWRRRKPTDWGMDAGTWSGVGAEIVGNFNALDPSGVQIDETADDVRHAIDNVHDEPLGVFHQYLVDKARRLDGRAKTILRELKDVNQ